MTVVFCLNKDNKTVPNLHCVHAHVHINTLHVVAAVYSVKNGSYFEEYKRFHFCQYSRRRLFINHHRAMTLFSLFAFTASDFGLGLWVFIWQTIWAESKHWQDEANCQSERRRSRIICATFSNKSISCLFFIWHWSTQCVWLWYRNSFVSSTAKMNTSVTDFSFV